MSTDYLPPLHALRAFEAVARLGGVRQAAMALHVSPPAVSYQLAKLEEHLGVQLFERREKKLIPTDIARNYMIEIGPCLDVIGRATLAASSRKQAREILTLSAPPSLVANWLIPRLLRFRNDLPDIDLRIVDKMTLDPSDNTVDAGIEYRFDANPALVSQAIFSDEIIPLASPQFIEQNNIVSLESLRDVTLIETSRRLTSWKTILHTYKWSRHLRLVYFSFSLHSFAAAEQGLGVALGNRLNVASLLNSAALRFPFTFDPDILPPLPRYYISCLPSKDRMEKVQSLKHWLYKEISAMDN